MYNFHTVSYSSFPIAELLNVLQQEEINAFSDVRSRPFSNTFPDYGMDKPG